MVVRYDPEPALQAVVEAAKNGFQGQLIWETIRSALETSYGVKLGDDSVILTWMVEHAGTLRNLFHRSGEIKDGKTPYSRHRGREWRVSLPPFGEAIEFLKREATSLKQGGNRGFFLESRTTPPTSVSNWDPVGTSGYQR